MSKVTKAMKLVAPRIKGLAIHPHNNNGLRFGCGVGLRAEIELPPMLHVERPRTAPGGILNEH